MFERSGAGPTLARASAGRVVRVIGHREKKPPICSLRDTAILSSVLLGLGNHLRLPHEGSRRNEGIIAGDHDRSAMKQNLSPSRIWVAAKLIRSNELTGSYFGPQVLGFEEVISVLGIDSGEITEHTEVLWQHGERSALDRGSPSTMWRSNSITDTPSTSRLVIFHATLFPPHREIVPRRLIPEQLSLPTTARNKNVISTAAWGARPVPRDRV